MDSHAPDSDGGQLRQRRVYNTRSRDTDHQGALAFDPFADETELGPGCRFEDSHGDAADDVSADAWRARALPRSELPPVVVPKSRFVRGMDELRRRSLAAVRAGHRARITCALRVCALVSWFVALATGRRTETDDDDDDATTTTTSAPVAQARRRSCWWCTERAIVALLRVTCALIGATVVYAVYAWTTVDVESLRTDANRAYADGAQRATTHVNPFAFVREHDAGVNLHAPSRELDCALLAYDRAPLPLEMGGPRALSLAALRVNAVAALRGVTDAVRREHYEHLGYSVDAHRCVCAPMFGARVRMLSLTVSRGGSGGGVVDNDGIVVEHLYNPVLGADADDAGEQRQRRRYTVHEDRTAWMPATYGERVSVVRDATVHVRYVNASCHRHTLVVRMEAAFCVQLCMDFIDGRL